MHSAACRSAARRVWTADMAALDAHSWPTAQMDKPQPSAALLRTSSLCCPSVGAANGTGPGVRL
jgi:hypothetical protein